MPPATTLPQYTAHELEYPLVYTQAGTGIPLLLIHGSLCDYRYWRWQIPAMAVQMQVVAPSLRGYWPNAFSTENTAFSVARHAGDLAALIRSRHQPMHVLGHSRGAQVALELACSEPALVRSLILADPGFPLPGESGSHSFQIEVVEHLHNGDIEGAMQRFVDTVNGTGTWGHMVRWFKEMVKDNAYTLLSQIQERNLVFDPERARHIACPVLLLGGADSPARFGKRIDALQVAIRHAERTTIPLASHGMNLANPRAFNERVLQFVNNPGD